MEAKAAYILAEETFGKGDYKATIEFLQQAKNALSKTNCKLLYLEIMATRELYAKDSSKAEKLLPLITEFEKSSDYADFNEEKTLEIVKLKLLIKGEQKATKDKLMEIEIAKQNRIDSMAKARTPAHQDHFIRHVQSKGQFNITMDELNKVNPKWKVKKWIADKISSTVDFYHNPEQTQFKGTDFPFPIILSWKGSNNPFTILGVFVKDGKVIGYQFLFGSISLKSTAETYTNLFLLNPTFNSYTKSGVKYCRYLWAEGKFGIMIDGREDYYPYGNVETYFYNPTEKATSDYNPSEK
jgi:hypothetical protein